LNVNIKIFKTVILPVVLCGGENWSVTFSEERAIRVFENRVLRGIFGFKWDEVKRSGEKFIMRSLMICIADTLFFVFYNREEMVGGM
jgi:hypothetical protein